jgi:hypothetical protein
MLYAIKAIDFFSEWIDQAIMASPFIVTVIISLIGWANETARRKEQKAHKQEIENNVARMERKIEKLHCMTDDKPGKLSEALACLWVILCILLFALVLF